MGGVSACHCWDAVARANGALTGSPASMQAEGRHLRLEGQPERQTRGAGLPRPPRRHAGAESDLRVHGGPDRPTSRESVGPPGPAASRILHSPITTLLHRTARMSHANACARCHLCFRLFRGCDGRIFRCASRSVCTSSCLCHAARGRRLACDGNVGRNFADVEQVVATRLLTIARARPARHGRRRARHRSCRWRNRRCCAVAHDATSSNAAGFASARRHAPAVPPSSSGGGAHRRSDRRTAAASRRRRHAPSSRSSRASSCRRQRHVRNHSRSGG